MHICIFCGGVNFLWRMEKIWSNGNFFGGWGKIKKWTRREKLVTSLKAGNCSGNWGWWLVEFLCEVCFQAKIGIPSKLCTFPFLSSNLYDRNSIKWVLSELGQKVLKPILPFYQRIANSFHIPLGKSLFCAVFKCPKMQHPKFISRVPLLEHSRYFVFLFKKKLECFVPSETCEKNHIQKWNLTSAREISRMESPFLHAYHKKYPSMRIFI